MALRSLYPPVIDSYMPAFEVTTDKNQAKATCKIYFSLSKFNGSQDFKRVHISIFKQKTGTNAVNLKNDTSSKNPRYRETGIILDIIPTYDKEKELYYVTVSEKDLANTKGWNTTEKYKVQIRLANAIYNGNKNISQAQWIKNMADQFSEWSTICILTPIERIDFEIPILNDFTTQNKTDWKEQLTEDNIIYEATLVLSGRFIYSKNNNELIKNYQFIIYDSGGTEIDNSGQIYPSQIQSNGDFYYVVKAQLENTKEYAITFKFETNNGYIGGFYGDDKYLFTCSYYTLSVPPCRLITIENDVDNILKGITSKGEEEDEGRLGIKFYDPSNDPYNGNLCIRRSDARTNFKIWEDVYLAVVKTKKINDIPIFYDYNIESGVWYKYGVQLVEKDGTRGMLQEIPDPIMRNFNYTFLLGKNNQQLKLMFDNTMASFKYQIADSKLDPIGSKYTIVARNAATYYRTFPINGLISFWMDENNLFCNKKDIYKYEDVIDDYENYNNKNYITQYDYIYERDFREEVLKFLQDGEYKLFKSPTEGNIIVRLMDVNCVPNQSLDRMLYSFTSNAFEVDEYNLANCLKYGFYTIEQPDDVFETKETKLGQITGSFFIYKDRVQSDGSVQKTGDNIFKKIYDAYDKSDKNVAGIRKRVKKIHHMKITFEGDPLRIEQGDASKRGSAERNKQRYVVGNNFSLDGRQFTVYDKPIRIYEFDERVDYDKNNTLYFLGDAEGKKNKVKATIDFLYDSSTTIYKTKTPQNRKAKKCIGQLFDTYEPNHNLLKDIYYKYYIEWPKKFERLDSLVAIEIEANPGSAFAIRDNSEAGNEIHIVGITGQLRLYNIETISNLIYLGIQDKETGEIKEELGDITLNYMCNIVTGTYKEEK